jgi:hypothetical protein
MWLTMGANVGGTTTQYRRHDIGWFRDGLGVFTDTFTNMGHPFGTTGLESRASKASTRSRTYGCGGFTDNWMVDEHLRVWRQGMLPPSTPPAISVGAGSVVQIPYVAFYDQLTDEWSPLSAAGASVTGNVSRSWTGLPTEEVAHKLTLSGTTTANASTTIMGSATTFTLLRVGDRVALSSAATSFASVRSIPSDNQITVDRALGNGTTQTIIVRPAPRASHIGLFVSVDGALPRLAVLRQIGQSTASESTATLALGMAAFEGFTRLPRGSFNAIYHERQCIAGVVGEPDTLYVSEILFPERYGGLSFKTRNGEAIVGLIPCRNVLLALTAQNTYALRGYTEDDMVFEMIDADIGAFHHWSLQIVHGNAWVFGPTGVFLWNGNYHMMISDRLDEWQKDVAANQRRFERGFTMVDPEDYTIQFVLPASELDYTSVVASELGSSLDPVSGNHTVVWWADYYDTVPELSGNFKQPEWGFDTCQHRINGGAVLSLPGSSHGSLCVATCDGLIRARGVSSSDGAAEQAGPKTMLWMTGHYQMDDPGGDKQEGKTFHRLWTYMESENTNWGVAYLAGDEKEYRADMTLATIPASAESVPSGPDEIVSVPKTTHNHIREQLSGRGLIALYRVEDPSNAIRWRGFGGEWIPGPVKRGKYLVRGGG